MQITCSLDKITIKLTNNEQVLFLSLCDEVRQVIDLPSQENMTYQKRLFPSVYKEEETQINFDIEHALERHNIVSSNISQLYHSISLAKDFDKETKEFEYDFHNIQMYMQAINSIRITLSIRLGIDENVDPLEKINSDEKNSHLWYAYIMFSQLLSAMVDYLQNHVESDL